MEGEQKAESDTSEKITARYGPVVAYKSVQPRQERVSVGDPSQLTFIV